MSWRSESPFTVGFRAYVGFWFHCSPNPGILGSYIFKQAHKHGLIIRSIYDTIAFCPPLITTEDDVDAIFSAFERTLSDATDWARSQNLF